MIEKENNPPIQKVNKVSIVIDINGFKFDSGAGSKITYNEYSDYFNNFFPVRILTLECSFDMVQKIFNSQLSKSKGNRKMYDIKILSFPTDADGVKNKILLDGSYKCILRQNDSKNDFSESLKYDGRFFTGEQGHMMETLEFVMYREEELEFNISGNINFISNNPKLSDLFIAGFTQANPSMMLCVSKFDHNPNLGRYIISPMSFKDFMDIVEKDVGFYRTKYIEFVEHNIYFLLNRENNINVNYPDLEYTLVINVSRRSDMLINRYVRRLDDKTYEMSMSVEDIKIWRDNKQNFSNSVKYITPSGKVFFHKLGTSRNFDTIRKLSEVEPIKKLENPEYEMCKITLVNAGANFITPLTKFRLMDAMGKPRTYRLASKKISVVSGYELVTEIIGFRMLNEEANVITSTNTSNTSSNNSARKINFK